MTKLMEWLSGLTVLGVLWAAVTFDLLGLDPPEAVLQVSWPLPVFLLVALGCFSLGTVGYRVATFNDCQTAAAELQAQIREAKTDLQRKGLRF
ncbi:Dolichol-phosphate mannosyltransferase subunit 3 [Acipenser ruthenus]|uniref:Dolichol-phosphate mannosyltransferase subunit 3 n=1 Tax=Acipenser ruthenus TaxID=7906 RepID=A0A444UQN7_ACIRT|nr:Dolichol-phosphate mannosyltransferase subunit 3 [Acipenser ruthenus]